jgi:hypothetical protein
MGLSYLDSLEWFLMLTGGGGLATNIVLEIDLPY